MTVFYADFGNNTDADAQVAAGVGTIGDPFNAKAFIDKAKWTGTGIDTDEYLIKGQAYTNITIGTALRAASINSWDLDDFGPWQFESQLDTNFGVSTSSVISNGIMKGNKIALAMSTYNDIIFMTSDVTGANQIGTTNLNGCTVIGDLKFINGSNTLNMTDCILTGNFVKQGDGAHTINLNNSVMIQSLTTIENISTWTVNNTDSQFEYVSTITYPEFAEVDPDLFKVDPAITVTPSGNYTNYETGMFGHSREDYEAEMSKPPTGASYFALPVSGGGAFAGAGIGLGLGMGI